jgi:imidazole glycerol phosphate synthase subunit HisF
MWKCYCKTEWIKINSSAIKIQLINDLASKFGSQCVVRRIDAKQIDGQWIVHLIGGKVPTELNLFDWAVEVAEEEQEKSCLPRWTMTETVLLMKHWLNYQH